LRERGLFPARGTVLVACSGGPDSQVLLHALHALRATHGCALIAAAVDHGLRAEAGRELDLAEALADALQVPFVRLRVAVEPGASLQAQARRARYAALSACAAEHAATRIAVGHTLDDQAETVLARLIRGTGLEGLSAIEPRRADGVVRPLLDVPRALVQRYLREQGLSAAHDPSNDDPRFLRVRIRRQLLPALARENPQAAQLLAYLADDAREGAEALAALADEALSQARSGPDPVRTLREAKGPVRRRALRRWAEQATGTALRRHHILALERMLSVGGEVRLPGAMVAQLDAAAGLTFRRVSKRGRGGARRIQETAEARGRARERS
jgi:tRNA(Ile)-lysidine synthase